MASIGNKEEPNTGPQPDRWYNLTLGSSLKDNATKFCTLRYEFKPASIDKSKPGSLYKSKDNRVTVEFQNNQQGKPKLSFEGSSEDYKDNDAVLFFDGQTFRLERLHRAVKRLRHVRLPGESTASAAAAAASAATTSALATSVGGSSMDTRSPPLGKAAKSQPPSKLLPHSIPVEVERIDIGESENSGTKPTGRGVDDYHNHHASAPNPSVSLLLPDQKSDEIDEEHLNQVIDEIDVSGTSPKTAINSAATPTSERGGMKTGFDINLPSQYDTDDETAYVDVSDGEVDKGPNAAEALRAQVKNAVVAEGSGGGQTSSSSGSSDSGSSSGSASSSSDSESASEDDSVNSV